MSDLQESASALQRFNDAQAGRFEFTRPRVYVGFWLIGGEHGLRVAMTVRPRALTRVLSSWLLQWQWHDGDVRQRPKQST